ncbi:MAG: hypothetical protein NC821_05745 [Candidatus Omnitrophica bacterium]|nr:hypothetical protein [Candidatus Omnitrophota bacterium]
MWTLLPVQENYYKKQGTILISAFWILTILLLVVLAFAWRISLELKISRFFTSRVRVTSAARAGLYWAMEVKENKDTTPYDSLKDTWINNEEIFGDILKSREKEEAEAEVNIKYVHHLNEKNEPEYYYGLIDEERKINLNLGLTINITININGQEMKININSFQILEKLKLNFSAQPFS